LSPSLALSQGNPAGPAKRRPPRAAPDAFYRDNPAAMAFAHDLAQRRGLDLAWVRDQLGRARRLEASIRGATPPPTGMPKHWSAHRARFIEPVRLAEGQRFWQEHGDALARAETEYGVPASLIVGVIGVETLYGRHTGTHKV